MDANKTNFDPTKPVRTRDGHPARIICTDAKLISGRTIVCLWGPEHDECFGSRFPDGRINKDSNHPYDLINIPEPVVTYHNVYPTSIERGWKTLANADQTRNLNCLAVLKLTYVPGEGASVEVVEEYTTPGHQNA